MCDRRTPQWTRSPTWRSTIRLVWRLPKPCYEYNEPVNLLVTTDKKTVFASRPRIRLKFGQDEDPLTMAEIAGRINDFGKNPGALSGLIERAHQHVRQKFTNGTQAAAMLMLYTKLLSDGRS